MNKITKLLWMRGGIAMIVRFRILRTGIFALIVLVFLIGCGLFSQEMALTEPAAIITDLPVYRASPVAQSPASGICGIWEGDMVTFTIYPDIPDPRCSQALPGQKLRVINQREEVIHASIGLFAADIEPGGEFIFEAPLGEYLMPGVHVVKISPCCSPELILKE